MSQALKRAEKYCPQIMDIFFPDSFPPVHILAPPRYAGVETISKKWCHHFQAEF